VRASAPSASASASASSPSPDKGQQGKKSQQGERGGEGTDIDTSSWIEVEALAVAKRRRDVPRMSEAHEEGAEVEEEEAADDEMKVCVCA
jgi:hypothetical protein